MYKVYAQDCYARNGLNSIISDIKGIENIELTVLYDQDECEVSTLSRYWRDKDIACIILTNTNNKKILVSKNVLVMSIKSSVDEIKKAVESFISNFYRVVRNSNVNYRYSHKITNQQLTDAEVRVVRYLCRGVSPAKIASTEKITVKMVSLYKRSAMVKINARTTQDLFLAFSSSQKFSAMTAFG